MVKHVNKVQRTASRPLGDVDEKRRQVKSLCLFSSLQHLFMVQPFKSRNCEANEVNLKFTQS